ncbi:MAG: hypothetical protein Q7T55_09035, partial [Solirubrobacteraceae bacterium]|nr:hypothetical protein [Solirubrobacteraceae bacterium]
TMKTLTKGSLPITGGLEARIVQPGGGSVTGVLSLNPSSGNLTALGFLPVVARVDFVSAEPVSGDLENGKLRVNAKVRIKLPSVKTLGIELAGGANCQAKQISSITLSSTQPTFAPSTGGSIAGTFAISNLTGCGFLTNLVSPLTQGSGNLIAVNLTKK